MTHPVVKERHAVRRGAVAGAGGIDVWGVQRGLLGLMAGVAVVWRRVGGVAASSTTAGQHAVCGYQSLELLHQIHSLLR
jgi:hypothetical protein